MQVNQPEDQTLANSQTTSVQFVSAHVLDDAHNQISCPNLDRVGSEGGEDQVLFAKSMQTQVAKSFQNLTQLPNSDSIQSSKRSPTIQTVIQNSVLSDPHFPQRHFDAVVDGGTLSDPT